jgi:hypothetical protein
MLVKPFAVVLDKTHVLHKTKGTVLSRFQVVEKDCGRRKCSMYKTSGRYYRSRKTTCYALRGRIRQWTKENYCRLSNIDLYSVFLRLSIPICLAFFNKNHYPLRQRMCYSYRFHPWAFGLFYSDMRQFSMWPTRLLLATLALYYRNVALRMLWLEPKPEI